MQKMSEKDKITIDEIIEHCNKTCEMAEMYAIKQGKTQDDITAKSYWEHYQVLKYIEELKQYRAIGTVEELQKSVKEEDILKFYYIESEDKYVVGQRVDNFYYAEIGKTGISYRMSRYLPWGQHVIAPETAWKEYTYPSEPKEIPFFEWLQGYIKKECGATVEECREAVERMKSKKPIMRYGCIYRCPPDCGGKEFDEYGDVPHCPTCNRVLHSLDDICKCGQK